MMMRRRRGVGLLVVAAVAGVAHHAGSKSAQASANEQSQNQELADLQAQNDALAAQQQLLQAGGGRRPAPVAALRPLRPSRT
jgi:cell division protein FtsB